MTRHHSLLCAVALLALAGGCAPDHSDTSPTQPTAKANANDFTVTPKTVEVNQGEQFLVWCTGFNHNRLYPCDLYTRDDSIEWVGYNGWPSKTQVAIQFLSWKGSGTARMAFKGCCGYPEEVEVQSVPYRIVANPNGLQVNRGQAATISVEVFSRNNVRMGIYKNTQWTSRNPGVATVQYDPVFASQGTITGVGPGATFVSVLYKSVERATEWSGRKDMQVFVP